MTAPQPPPDRTTVGLDTPPAIAYTTVMMETKQTAVGVFDLVPEAIERVGSGGLFLVTGSVGNPMTIGWVLFGRVWGKPILQVLVRPSRHSFSLLAGLGEFTVGIPRDAHKAALATCGTLSGRDTDKARECGLTLVPAAAVTVPVIADCSGHFECRVVHVNDVVNATLDPLIVAGSYPKGDFHRVYYGEIVAAARHNA